jgi:hypothetical protein
VAHKRFEIKTATICFKNNGDLYKKYSSINEAAKELNLGSGNICKVLKGERNTTKNFVFKYV